MGLPASFRAGRPIVSLLFRLLRLARAACRDCSIPAHRDCPSASTRVRSAVQIVLATAVAVVALYPAHAQGTIPHSCEHEGDQYRQPGDPFTTTYARCPASVTDDGGKLHEPPVLACKVGGIPQYRNELLCTTYDDRYPSNCNCKDGGVVVSCYTDCEIVDGGNTSGGDTSGGNTSGGDTSGGNTSGGDTSGGNTSGGNTGGGDTSGGNTSGGNTSGGDTSGGNTSGGDTSGGSGGGGGGGSGGGRAEEIELSIGDVTVDEDAGEAHFTVSVGATTASQISVEYRTVDGTARAGLDYTETTGRLTLAPRAKQGTITVPILDDVLAEPDETFTVVLDKAVDAEIADGEATGTIVDDEAVPNLTIDDVGVTEDGGEARFTVSLDTESTEAVTVEYATADDTAIAGSDYTSTRGTLTIAAGSLSGTIAVPVLDDALDELDETFTLTLSNATNALISDGEGTGTIADDDVANLSVDDVAVAEDEGQASFTVMLDQAAPQAVTVEYATADGTAAAGSDYESASGSLTITAGSLSGTIVVPILDDAVPELAETFRIILSDAVNATISDDEATGTITDNDTPTLGIEDITVDEDAGSADFTVMLDQVGMDPVTVEYATADGTAVAGSDYTSTSGTLTIAAGSLSGTIAVPVLDDALDELDETFTLTLSNATNALISDGEGTGTIADDDVANLSVDDVAVAEDEGQASFTVMLDQAAPQAVTVEYATADGTAAAGSDYESASGSLTITAGSLSGTIVVPILDDAVPELAETFRIILSDAVNATISDDEATGTITDNDTPNLSIEDITVAEDAGSARFTVMLDQTGMDAVTVEYATADGTATAGSDYTSTNGTLTIAAGSLSGTITVPVLDDTLDELDETFRLTLSNAANALISDGEGTGTITDDDVATLRIDDVTVAEDEGAARFTVMLDQAGPGAVTVEYATADGTAAAGSDYESASGSLTITAGSLSGTIVVPILDDAVPELAETFRIILSDAVNATISDDEATGTITDNDTPNLSIEDITVAEDAGSARFTVMLDQTGMDAVTVEYATADGTATAGSDYTSTSGTLTIAAGSLSGTITVPVLA